MTAQQMRDHADECRQLSELSICLETVATYLRLADDWERMAAEKDQNNEYMANRAR